ncbi:class I SAM-dependent methyltransferase [Catellatospora sichuanensis]|uniref:class I SAM-dependent methyltransferase n=1 Tax=Catellatospora sichuanensis TaxID=1969805 RepID=UPI0011834D38|nr:class I SAM-dependent methyltransferase [Catellatospora sichuanensis]
MTTAFDAYERRLWQGRASAYQLSFAALCGRTAPALLDAAGVGERTRLLDVGTGTGTVAALAATRGAVVTAVDAEQSMVEAARRAVPGADVRHGVLPDLPLDDHCFDVTVGNFVVNHVGDPAAAASELRRVTRPGGRVAVSIWPVPAPPLQQIWGSVAAACGLRRPDSAPTVAEELNFTRDEDGLAHLLRGAGLAEVSAHTVTWTHRADPEDWWAGPANGIGVLGAMLGVLSVAEVAKVKAEYDRTVAAHLDESGRLALPTAAVIAVGRVP